MVAASEGQTEAADHLQGNGDLLGGAQSGRNELPIPEGAATTWEWSLMLGPTIDGRDQLRVFWLWKAVVISVQPKAAQGGLQMTDTCLNIEELDSTPGGF